MKSIRKIDTRQGICTVPACIFPSEIFGNVRTGMGTYDTDAAEGSIGPIGTRSRDLTNDNDDDVYLINYNMAVGYNIYLHTNTDQPERYKYKMKLIRKTCS
jgi:hypothetical protein